MLMKKTLLALTVSAFCLGGCGSSSSDDKDDSGSSSGFEFDATELITNLTNDVIVEGYKTLNTKAESFSL
ncbi:MAG: iron-regulated protein A precursor, partial [Colwellia sp.]|nr:iron-regulated protein A precursor [Colwellia sp.]